MLLLSGLSLYCYQCDSRFDPDCKEQFDHEHIDQLIVRPTECTVDAAQFCIKTIGVWGGLSFTHHSSVTCHCGVSVLFNSVVVSERYTFIQHHLTFTFSLITKFCKCSRMNDFLVAQRCTFVHLVHLIKMNIIYRVHQ